MLDGIEGSTMVPLTTATVKRLCPPARPLSTAGLGANHGTPHHVRPTPTPVHAPVKPPSLPCHNDDVCVAITGGAGQIAYALVPLIMHGRVFAEGRKVRLRLLDIEACAAALEGVAMEIRDCYSDSVCCFLGAWLAI